MRQMAKPLNWILSGSAINKATGRTFRNRLAATTILAVVPFLGYGRQAYAACSGPPPADITCTGTFATGISISYDNANVTAQAPFSVTDQGVYISGDGHIQFTDNNASSIKNYTGTGLHVTSYGDTQTTPGAVTITTNDNITGYDGDGIYARNRGTGDITITADGHVTGEAADGIYAINYGKNITITTGANSKIEGQENGIDARNYSNFEDAGNLTITADGYVSGYTNDGIHAVNEGVDLTITTGAQSIVLGGGHGIGAYNYGDGDTTITANGFVSGYGVGVEFPYPAGDGIHAVNGEDTYSLTITTGAQSTILGTYNGIKADNYGSGPLTVTANGVVEGYGGNGIYARNGGYYYNPETEERTALTITTGAGSNVSGYYDGIRASNYGHGDVFITANGVVSGNHDDGINAYNSEDGLAMTITTGPGSVVAGAADDGINAYQDGDGDLTINVNGTVTGNGADPYEDDSGGFGIESHQTTFYEDGETFINVGGGGVVQGYVGGIYATTWNSNITITNDGVVRNLSAKSYDLAIRTDGDELGNTTVNNNANLIGTVHFDAVFGKDVVNNAGFWNMAGGESDFGGDPLSTSGSGIGDELNNTGVLLAADDSTTSETTEIYGLEFFNNNGGVVSLVDGKEGDTLEVQSNAAQGTQYTGTNGKLAVDAALGPGTGPNANDHLSDELFIHGSTWGNTTVLVNVVAVNGVNTDGIPVILVDGETHAGDFTTNGPVNGGFFLWDMRFDDVNNWHELYTVTTNPDGTGAPVPGAGALMFPAGFGAGQDIWWQTIGTALDRQADFRALFTGMGVTPVADVPQPVEPTPLSPKITPGFWYKAFGAYVDRDDEQNGVSLDHNQTTYGGMAGFDFGTQDVGDAMLFGIFGGYIVSNVDFKATNSDWDYEGPTVGAYATYLNEAFYADLTVKADFLNVNIDPGDLAADEDDSDTDALNVGGRVDMGYKLGHMVYLEPQASLGVVYTDVDDVDIFGGTVEFDDQTDVRGRLGLRVGLDDTQLDDTVYSADVTASVWEDFTNDNKVNIIGPGIPDFGASDNPAETYGDLSLGLSAASPDGWSAFLRGNYLFAEDYEAVTGSAGVRIAW
jgi:autotransporter family porin